MPKISKKDYMTWLKFVLKDIETINELSGANLHGKRELRFGYVGAKHKIALWRDNQLVSTGMKGINKALAFLLKYYERRKLDED